MSDARGVIFDIKRYAIHDGPGIRSTVFLMDCPMRCPWCHNPESWYPPADEERPDLSAKGAARNGVRNALGREVTASELVGQLERDVLFYDESGGGVTFSGGEPLAQPEFLRAALQLCKQREIHTALDTACHADWAVLQPISELVDLFLCDLKHMDPAEHERQTGVPNGLILDNLRRLARGGRRMIIRIPVVPGVNDGEENIAAAGRFVASLGSIERIELLPYHPSGESKLARVGFEPPPFVVPTPGQLRAIASVLVGFGVSVKIGG